MSIDEHASAGAVVRFAVVPHSNYYAPEDPRTEDEKFALQQALLQGLPDGVRSRPGAGEKGVVTDVLIPLASSGGFTAAAQVFTSWLRARPKHRRIDVSYELQEGDASKREGTFQLEATDVDDAVLDTIAREVLKPRT
jgi:hypothetical protein